LIFLFPCETKFYKKIMEKALNFRAFSFLVRIYALEMDAIGLLIPESAPMRRVADFFP